MKVTIKQAPKSDIEAMWGGGYKPIADNPYSKAPTLEFVGKSHEKGGIGVNFKGNPVEVEGGETAQIDDNGDMNVMGNMYVPSTNMKFKTLSKQIAKQENKAAKNFDLGKKLISDSDPQDKFEALSFNSGRAMMKGADMKQRELAEKKEALTSLQQEMLDTASKFNIDPQEMSKGNIKKAKNGMKIKAKIIKAPQGTVVKDENPLEYLHPIEHINNNYETFVNNGGLNPEVPNYIPTEQTPFKTSDGVSFSKATPLPIGEITPELYALATNKKQGVQARYFTPQLYEPYQVSFQDQLNKNQETFSSLSRQLANNPEALSTLAAQKYEADQGVLGNEFRTNQQINNDVHNKNTALLNQAELTNLGIGDQQYVRQEQARSNTLNQNYNILGSISSKLAQNNYENQQNQLYENLYNFRFNDTNGDNIPDKAEYVGGPANFNFSGSNFTSPYNARTTYVSDGKGNLVRQSKTIPSLTQQQLEEERLKKARSTNRLKGVF